MDQSPAEIASRGEGSGSLHRLTRAAMVVYLSPLILVVLAIGLVGVVAARLGTPAARVGAVNAHTPHRPPGAPNLAKAPTRVRQTA